MSVALYAVTGTVSISDSDGWTRSRQFPTFYLDPKVQGIMDESHAESIALTILDPFGDADWEKTFNVTVVAIPEPVKNELPVKVLPDWELELFKGKCDIYTGPETLKEIAASDPAIREFIKNDRRIMAIKELREYGERDEYNQCAIGLKQAKDTIDEVYPR